MRQIALSVLLLFVSNVWAEGIATLFFKFDAKYSCMNYASKMRILAKLEPKKYEVVYEDPGTGERRGHMILFTTESEFAGEGLVVDDLWVKLDPDHPEHLKVDTTMGSKREMEVVRESSQCATKSAYLLKHPSKEELDERKQQEEEDKQDAINDQRSLEDSKAAMARDMAFMKLSKADRKKETDRKAKESADKWAKWWTVALEKRLEICRDQGNPAPNEESYCW